ncbi:MAG TPA: hypothetical protein VEK31_06340 [Xanthobacteraceae bacterium]|nr:hypothetical protein [Xanthobacteraceae bacterium]
MSIQAKSGASGAVMAWTAVMVLALLTAFVFICVAGYDWLSLQLGPVFAGLVMTGIFLFFAIVAAVVGSVLRRRAKERAILARAAKAHAPSWLLDPRTLATAMQIGREIGWQRVVPLALLGFFAAQWARERRDRGEQQN